MPSSAPGPGHHLRVRIERPNVAQKAARRGRAGENGQHLLLLGRLKFAHQTLVTTPALFVSSIVGVPVTPILVGASCLI